MKDLLGDDLAPTPSMTAPLPYTLYELTSKYSEEPEYWAARTELEVRDAFEDAMETPPNTCAESQDAHGLKLLAETLARCVCEGALYLYGGEDG